MILTFANHPLNCCDITDFQSVVGHSNPLNLQNGESTRNSILLLHMERSYYTFVSGLGLLFFLGILPF